MPLVAGTRLGSYEIVSPLGVGGMGEVYRATDTKLGRDVAIKVIPESFAADPDRMARFNREAQILASLNHPNIAAIYGVEDRALVMELVGGSTLEERLLAGAIPVEEALPIAKQIAEALEYAHERGVIHRDLKPANIKLTPEGRVKVLDFGLAKALTGDVSSSGFQNSSPTLTMRATVAGMIMGTAAYMSPEQAKGRPLDRRTDIWSFGVVLVELLTGRQMYAGETPTEVLAAVITQEPDFSHVPAGTPAAVRKLLRRCLDKDTQRRLRDIGEARIAIDESLSSGAPEESPVAALPDRRWTFLVSAIAGVLLIALLAVSWLHLRESQPDAALVKLPLLPPAQGVFESIAISPDGRLLAFTASDRSGRVQLWLRPLDSLAAQPVGDTDGASQPFWSPDSRFVGFFADRKLKKVDVAGGRPQTIANVSSGRGAAWGGDGTIIFSQGSSALYRVPSTGGEIRALTTLDTSKRESFHRWPAFLPDGHHYLFTIYGSQPDRTGIFAGSLDSKDRVRLAPDSANAVYVPGKGTSGYLLFARDGALVTQPFDTAGLRLLGEPVPVADDIGMNGGLQQFLQYSASSTGILVFHSNSGKQFQLNWFDRTGKRLEAVGERGLGGSPRLSPDGKRVVASETSTNAADLYIIGLEKGTSSRLTFDRDAKLFPVWHPDGGQIVFASNRNGIYDLFRKRADGTGHEELLLSSKLNKYPSDVSPDGRFLLYTQLDPETNFDIWVLPLTGAGREPVPFVRTTALEQNGAFSPDGKWIAYTSDESGRPEIYLRSFSGPGNPGGQWQISKSGGMYPKWRGDGKELYYLSADNRITAVTLEPVANLQIGTPQPLFVAHFGNGSTRFTVTPDGKRFLMEAPPDEAGANAATVILNWTRALRQ